MLGRLYSFGSPFTKSDETQSVALTRKAAEQGHQEAQSNLGYFYYSGRGLPDKNPQLAAQWWTKAAERGFAQAQHNLASYYGREKDDAKSFEWNLKAAEQGLADAQTDVGSNYLRGTGTSKNVEQALDWYRKAAMQGSPRGMLNMAATLTMIGPADPRFYGIALAALDEPLLRSVESAQKLRSSICAASPASCGKNPK
jgi:hypothetical protein